MSNSGPWLTVLGIVPLVGALVIGLLPARKVRLAKNVAMLTALVVLGLTIAISAAFDPDGDRFQFVDAYEWIPAFGISYAVGVDGVALVLIALIAVLVPVVLLASWHDADQAPNAASTAGTADARPVPPRRRSVKTFLILLLVLETLMIGVFAAIDVFLFYVFFEAMLIPVYFLIGSYGGPRRSYAAMKFLLYSLAGGLLMLAALIGLYVASADQGVGTFAFPALLELELGTTTEILLFLGFFIAFAIKAPLWPFHTWLPDAGAEAPIGTAVLLVGVLDKVGTFGFLRYCLPLFPDASETLAPYIIALCVIGILYGALVAMGQKDIKRLISYTSVSHFGFIALGIFAFTTQAQTGAVLYMVTHGLSTGALFLVAGFLIARGRTRLIAAYGGVGQIAPVLSGVFLVAGLSSLALPGLVTFVAEFLVLLGTFPTYPVAAVLATLGIILAALYILLTYQRTMQGPLLLPAGIEPPAGFRPLADPHATAEPVGDVRPEGGLGPQVPDDAPPGLVPQPGGVATRVEPERAASVRTVVPRFFDLDAREAWAVAPLIALMIFLGFYPKPITDVIQPAVEATMIDVGRVDPAPTQGSGEPETTAESG